MKINLKEFVRVLKKTKDIFFEHGPKALFIRVFSELRSRLIKRKWQGGNLSVETLLNNRFSNIQAIESMKIDRLGYRLNIVTDSIKKDSLLGGVATALILAVLYCNERKMPLRIITRTSETNPLDFENFLKMMEITKPIKVEYYADYDRSFGNNNYKLEVSEKDIFMATSWWAAHAIRSVNLREKMFYILQEVEPFFYPNGDEQSLCEEVLDDPRIEFVINSKLLYDFYKDNGYDNVIKNGIYFEPAFIEKLYSANKESFGEKEQYKLFFYSRPNNPRNLFYRGIEIIDEALNRGILDDSWEIFFAGSDVPPVTFSNGRKPKILGQMTWADYSNFLKKVDLGLCLMYTPHPSYPPLDIASSGGVVLTNSYKNKKNLYYSKNIVCKKMNKNEFLQGLELAVNLAKDREMRKMNYDNNLISVSWDKSFKKVIEYMNKNK